MIGSDKPEATSTVSQEKNTQLLRLISHALLVGGFLLMMLDIRFEHKSVVGEMPIAWLPIFYSMSMLVLIPVGVMLWARGGKYLLTACYVGAAIVGMTGIYFHSDGHLIDRLSEVIGIWKSWSYTPVPNAPFYPPILAPFSFLGLGSIGLLFTYSENFLKRP